MKDHAAVDGPFLGAGVHAAKFPGGGFAGSVGVDAEQFPWGTRYDELLDAIIFLKASAEQVDGAS